MNLEDEYNQWRKHRELVEKKMEAVMKRCIRILTDLGKGSDIEEYTDDEFIWHGSVYCAVEFGDFEVNITLSDPYADISIDEYAQRHGIPYGEVDWKVPEVDEEITLIAQEMYLEDAKTLKEELASVIRYLKRSKYVAAIYMQPCEASLGSVDETIYKKRKGSKEHIDRLVAKEKRLSKNASQYCKKQRSSFMGELNKLVMDAIGNAGRGAIRRREEGS